MTILSCKTIFELTFLSAISENLLGVVFSQSPKNCDFGHFSAHLVKIGQNKNFYQKSAMLFNAEFQKNRWSGFRDLFVTYIHTSIHTYKGDPIEPVAFAGSIMYK